MTEGDRTLTGVGSRNDDITKEGLWERICAIRANWGDQAKLRELLDEWDRDFGSEYDDKTLEALAENVRKNAAAWAKQEGISTPEDIVRSMWEGWTEGEFTIDRTDAGIQIRCTKCPIADSYLAIDKAEAGLLFQCSEDPYIVEGTNPNMNFRRTKTLMAGDDCCDHFYSMD
ncbi:MAG: L-2-amino-thiazoline-4-carboxylic acid hydrolase [Candidatus Thorarchaeota archaeon]|nr:MAG: L-2-amino-thiazoline-4-carboxylic acid hydrolase [Candidatus Thorarchaeota archaeon]